MGDHQSKRSHYKWLIEEITNHIGFNDLTTEELIALHALLAPAHSRFLEEIYCAGGAREAKLAVVREMPDRSKR